MPNPSPARRVTQERRLRWIPLKLMRTNPRAQREFNRAWGDHLTTIFDPDSLQTPHVNERDGWFYVMDGQHGVHALKAWLGDWEDQTLQCWTYVGLTEEQEAKKFRDLNRRKNVDPMALYLSGLTAGEPRECDVERTVRSQGLSISKEKVPGAISAVTTILKVYDRSGPVVLGRDLRITRDAWGQAGFESSVIDGIGMLCHRFNGDIDDAEAVEKLGSMHGGVKGLLNLANVERGRTGRTKAQCVAFVATEVINRGRARGKKLPSWWAQ